MEKAEDLRSPPNSAEQRYEDDDSEEEEETLSLCDLPIYSDSFKWEDSFSTRNSSNSFENDDFFEFFSAELTNIDVSNTDNIVFCGKLIPYKGNDEKAPPTIKQRVSVAASPVHTTKPGSRWYSYMFGMVRVPPPEMELRDMRTRQSRRHRRSHSSGAFSSFGTEKVETTKRQVSSERNRPGGLKGLWWLWRAVGCRSRHVENVAKAAYGAVPRVRGA